MPSDFNRREFLRSGAVAGASAISMGAMVEFLSSCGTSASSTASVNQSAYSQAKKLVSDATKRVTTWSGPTTGPKAAPGKFIVYTSQDQTNGGALGVGKGVQEACAAIGWRFHLIDGQGTTTGMLNAINEAVALKPDGIVDGTIDATSLKTAWEKAATAGIKVVGWHAAATPGPVTDPPMITNIESDPIQTGKVCGAFTLTQESGHPGTVVLTDNAYAIAIAKSDQIRNEIEKVDKSGVLAYRNTPLADVQSLMSPLMTALNNKYGKKLNWMAGINDLYFDYAVPPLRSLGVPPSGSGTISMVSAGDGSVSAFNRIRQDTYQRATVPEPLNMHGWQAIDELNRAFNGAPPSGFVTPVHLVTKENIKYDGGPNNIFDPSNGYREHYKKIWGVSA